MSDLQPQQVPFIYNLFPPLAGTVDLWPPHVLRAREMGFNWIFLNPVQFPGESGSLYSVHSYDRLNPRFFPQETPEAQFEAFGEFVASAREAGTEIMADLVVNHTAHDSPLIEKHPEWYKRAEDGSVAHPGAMDNGHWVIWGDLAEIDNENSPDKSGLYSFWWEMVERLIRLGVRGFRCDAAYKVPVELWTFLIGRAKELESGCTFFAETLGCPFEDNLALTRAGFDYTFNSGKWWDYRQDWFLDQLRESAGVTRSICFPESHDTERLMEEYRGDVPRVKQHYAFTALITSGVMTVAGFEFGNKKRCHVVKTTPDDWQEGAGQPDLRPFITAINRLKAENPVFQEDNHVEKVDLGTENIMGLKKTSLDRSRTVLILLNLYDQRHGAAREKIRQVGGFDSTEVLAGALQVTEKEFVLDPWGYAVLAE
jgi:starch synthase (maltosyl-transferring)